MTYIIDHKEQIIESLILVLLYFVLRLVSNKIINSVGLKFAYPRVRVQMLSKIINSILFYITAGIVLFIWGVDQNKIVYYTTSLLAIIGIAFFAQWSIISNITSTIIVYFSHPVKVGDTISVLDKDYHISGRIMDISIFFLTIKTIDGEEITMPSNIFMQKMIKKDRTAINKGDK
ncbi:mechanosensitive ion channel domain-containing protein [Fulvivirga lutea]|uniref:Mechanosensitive ion channel family protein n=1 Tax=Fulvivirga lutea TaxID=2810512 RepID=A0A974ZZW1_9BACT|nr:mechanosensitive ion channel domain-containing protein [Fulvivirga lutea]QSE96591.1 mechanosensitive ion channel family protein [Fulvivirga lutea]